MSARIDSGFPCVRTCVCCRGKAKRNELLRLVRDTQLGIILDREKCLAGRGAWVHLHCVEQLRLGMLRRAFRSEAISQQDLQVFWAKLKEKDLCAAPGGTREQESGLC